MQKYLPLLLFIGLAWGQPLNFEKNNKIVQIEVGEKLQINNIKYNLIGTDYLKQYILLLKGKSQKQDTLRFDSVISFKYYEKSLRSFSSNTVKYTKYGVLFGAIAGLPEGINYGFHWIVAGGILHGGLGALCGAVYSMLRPIASEKIILEKEGWYISN